MKDGPSFQLFAQDFFMDTVEWTAEEVGIYWRLLQAEWINGSLPNEPHRLARIAGISTKKFPKRWQVIQIKFIQNGDGRLINERLEETREAQRKYRELQKEKSKLGIEARKKTQPTGKPRGKPADEARVNPRLTSSSSSSNIKDTSKEVYILPSAEEVNNASIPKIKEFLDRICNDLYQAKIFEEAHAFKNKMLKEKQNVRAILHALIRCHIKQQFEKGDAWGYCLNIINVEGGNYNESEYRKSREGNIG